MVETCPKCGHESLDYKGKIDGFFYLYRCVMMDCSYQVKRDMPFEKKSIDEKLNIIYRMLRYE